MRAGVQRDIRDPDLAYPVIFLADMLHVMFPVKCHHRHMSCPGISLRGFDHISHVPLSLQLMIHIDKHLSEIDIFDRQTAKFRDTEPRYDINNYITPGLVCLAKTAIILWQIDQSDHRCQIDVVFKRFPFDHYAVAVHDHKIRIRIFFRNMPHFLFTNMPERPVQNGASFNTDVLKAKGCGIC